MTRRERREQIQEMIASPVLEIARRYNKATKNLERIDRKIASSKNWRTRNFYIRKRDKTLDNMRDMIKKFLKLCEDEHIAELFNDPKFLKFKIIDALDD
tara:strand:+ start:2776 stop:3072 length:297 start_codon:yes stop_codon:yes gene_type:complete